MVRAIWKLAKGLCTPGVVRINPVNGLVHGRASGIWVGLDAASWSSAGNLLPSNAANLFYAVEPIAASH
jgi:hypothetical protein